MARPGATATLRGKVVEELPKPGLGLRVAWVDVKRSWTSCGFVVAEYCPGSRRTLFATSDAESDTPRVVFDEPSRHWPATQTMEEELEATTGALKAKRTPTSVDNMGRRRKEREGGG
jgi:hypothetical protein